MLGWDCQGEAFRDLIISRGTRCVCAKCMKLLLISVFRRIGEAFRELATVVLRVRKSGPVSVKGEALRERFGVVFGCGLTWSSYFRGFSRSKGESFLGRLGAGAGWWWLLSVARESWRA